MSSRGNKIKNQAATHFVRLAVVDYVDVFTRPVYQNIILDSLMHCQVFRGLLINSWCLMTSQLQLVGSAIDGDLSSVLNDFKSYTAKKLIRAIHENPYERRKEWMLRIFLEHGQMNFRAEDLQFWQDDNQPKECFSVPFARQKIDYIHQNPVLAGFVNQAEDYRLSSAKNYVLGKYCGLLEVDTSLINMGKSFNSF